MKPRVRLVYLRGVYRSYYVKRESAFYTLIASIFRLLAMTLRCSNKRPEAESGTTARNLRLTGIDKLIINMLNGDYKMQSSDTATQKDHEHELKRLTSNMIGAISLIETLRSSKQEPGMTSAYVRSYKRSVDRVRRVLDPSADLLWPEILESEDAYLEARNETLLKRLEEGG